MSYVIMMTAYWGRYREEPHDDDAGVNDFHLHPDRCHPAGVAMCQNLLNNIVSNILLFEREIRAVSILTQAVIFFFPVWFMAL